MAENGKLHSFLRNNIKEVTLNYRMSQKIVAVGMYTYTHALRPRISVLPVPIVTALLESDIRKDIDKACLGLRHGWGVNSHSH